MSERPNIWKQLQAQPKIVVRSDSSVNPPVMNTMREALREVAEPKPDVPQVEPMAIPDEIHFEPLRVMRWHCGGGYVLEINGVKHYGETPLETLGQAVINGAFGGFNILLP